MSGPVLGGNEHAAREQTGFGPSSLPDSSPLRVSPMATPGAAMLGAGAASRRGREANGGPERRRRPARRGPRGGARDRDRRDLVMHHDPSHGIADASRTCTPGHAPRSTGDSMSAPRHHPTAKACG